MHVVETCCSRLLHANTNTLSVSNANRTATRCHPPPTGDTLLHQCVAAKTGLGNTDKTMEVISHLKFVNSFAKYIFNKSFLI